MYMTLTIVWNDVVLIANPVKMVYCDRCDHSVLYYTLRLSKTYPPRQVRNSFPLTIFQSNFIPSLSNLLSFYFPSKFTPPPPPPPPHTHTHTHRKNDRCPNSIHGNYFHRYTYTNAKSIDNRLFRNMKATFTDRYIFASCLQIIT